MTWTKHKLQVVKGSGEMYKSPGTRKFRKAIHSLETTINFFLSNMNQI